MPLGGYRAAPLVIDHGMSAAAAVTQALDTAYQVRCITIHDWAKARRVRQVATIWKFSPTRSSTGWHARMVALDCFCKSAN